MRLERLAVLALLAALMASCNPALPGGAPPGRPTDAPGTPIEVTLLVRASDNSTASIQYSDEQGSVQRERAAVPWEKTFALKIGDRVTLYAERSGPGSITCLVLVDGELLKTATGTGNHGSASCGTALQRPVAPTPDPRDH
jgi:hypothetical protein